MSINTVEKIDNLVPVNNILVSVSDKSGLSDFVTRMAAINPAVHFYSTGGTYAKIKDILADKAASLLTQVSDYTGQPETQGGLVKTLDFKIYLGLLTETYNDAHAADMQRTHAVYLDMVVVNLYPFSETISRRDVTPEQARGNIDIGGPCMLRAAAKNFLRVAPVVNPADYQRVLDEMENTDGRLTLETRFQLARTTFAHTAAYDQAITDFLNITDFQDIKACYQW